MFELMEDRNIAMAFRGGMAKLGQATMEVLIYKLWVFWLLHSLRQFDNFLLSQAAHIHEYNHHNVMSRSLWSCHQVSGAEPQAVPYQYTNSPLCTASPVICFLHWRCTASSWRSTRHDPDLFHINSLFYVCLLSFKFVKYYAKVMQHMLSISNSTYIGPFFRETIKERDSF